MKNSDSTEPIRVVIVDDHTMVAEGLALALSRHAGIDVVGVCVTAEQAIETVQQLAPAVVLMDYHLGDTTGAAVALAVRESQPDIVIIMISGDIGDAAMLAALDAGACGYIVKTETSDHIAQQVRRAVAGEMLVPAGTLQRLLRLSRTRVSAAAQRGSLLGTLTAREREVLSLMVEGKDNAAIADVLTISYNTVRGHVQSVLEKLGARTKLQAVAMAHAEGAVGD